MKLVEAVLGQELETEIFFRSDSGSGLVVAAPPKYEIRDFNDALVLSGFGSQDAFNLARWTTRFTIPTNSPIGKAGQKYKIVWSVKESASGDRYTQTDFFDVKSNIDFSSQYTDIDERLVIEQTFFEDTLIIPANIEIDSLSVSVSDILGTLIYDSGSLPTAPSVSDASVQVFNHKSAATIPTLVVAGLNCMPYQIKWVYNDGVRDSYVIHYLYAINARILDMLHQIRARIDKARNQSYNPALTYLDTDLLKYLDQGLSMFNAKKPVLTNFTMKNLPDIFRYPVLECSCYNALRAQLGAEGQATFNFGGQSVSLDMDRTQFIESELGRIQNYIDTDVPSVKRQWNRQGGIRGAAGVLGVNVGASFNWSPPLYNRGGLLIGSYSSRNR